MVSLKYFLFVQCPENVPCDVRVHFHQKSPKDDILVLNLRTSLNVAQDTLVLTTSRCGLE